MVGDRLARSAFAALGLGVVAATLGACSGRERGGEFGRDEGHADPDASSLYTIPDASTSADASSNTGAWSGWSGEDSDGDGVPDALEAKVAAEYMPFVSIHPSDKCKTRGMAYRVAPHPTEPRRLMVWVDVLYEQDCGANGHTGDNEMFSVVVDPSRPAPAGILAVRAISHQGTPCQQVTTCGLCPGMAPCSTTTVGGAAYPVVYASVDKHGNYVDKGLCDKSLLCDYGGCALATGADATPRVNVGEPSKPLVHDLTDQGFISTSNGWQRPELLHFDPWKKGEFGTAGDVSDDLVDSAFVIDTAACR